MYPALSNGSMPRRARRMNISSSRSTSPKLQLLERGFGNTSVCCINNAPANPRVFLVKLSSICIEAQRSALSIPNFIQGQVIDDEYSVP